MTKRKVVAALVLSVIFFAGCGGKRVDVNPKPNDPIFKEKNDFIDQYGFFMTPSEGEEFKLLATTEDLKKFEDEFFNGSKEKGKPSRDIDPSTPENEFKDLIDSRIEDIKNEALFSDFEVPGTRFSSSGGLRGDMAHVYLLFGKPCDGCKAKLPEGTYHVELVTWYYFDSHGRPVMRFLFYDDYGAMRLFKSYGVLFNMSDLFNPTFSPLRLISSRRGVNTVEEMNEIWLELEREDPEWIFRNALLEFSSYEDVVVEGGDEKRFGALDPPEPAELTARKFQPEILGQPVDLSQINFLKSSSRSLLTSNLEISTGNQISFTLVIGYSDVDWAVNEEKAETMLDLKINFQNKQTKNVKEFEVRLPIVKPRAEVEEKRKGVAVSNTVAPVVMRISLGNIKNFAQAEEPRLTLAQLIDSLEPGVYIVTGEIRNAFTKKYNAWREEITISGR